MSRRRLLTIAALVLAAGLAAGCADDVSPAIRVGDLTISHDDLNGELAEWAGNPQTQASQTLPVAGVEHGFALEPAGQIIGERILLALFEQEFDERGLELTDEDQANAFVLMGIDPSQEEQILGGFSEEFRDEYMERWAKVAAVQSDTASEEELRAVIGEGSDDVELSSRYGTWDPVAFAVTPPPGPAAPAAP